MKQVKYTITDIKSGNKLAGYHFFDRAAMAFFNSRVYPKVYQGIGGIYFITSEKLDFADANKYSVRRYMPDTGKVDTLGAFNRIDNMQDAIDHAKLLSSVCESVVSK